MDQGLTLAGKTFTSRLIVGTGKYPSHQVMQQCHQASGTQLVTVAVRRLDLKAEGAASLLSWLDTTKLTIEQGAELVLETLRQRGILAGGGRGGY